MFSDPKHSVTNLMDPTVIGKASPPINSPIDNEFALNEVEEKTDDDGGKVPGDTGGEDGTRKKPTNLPALVPYSGEASA